ncbi:MAG: iron-sulfur cluster insertion protein ErpA [Pseudomonadota bacterium]|nr:iron-sulfur cluster insertion protein ErpA [Pseudomonadota bacterium]
MSEEENLDLKLRVYIQGGGCSGFQYGFSFEESSQEDDYLLEKTILNFDSSLESEDISILDSIFVKSCQLLSTVDSSNFLLALNFFQKICKHTMQQVNSKENTVGLLIDAISYQYLKGAVIDYKVGIDGEYFSVSNPNAKTTCGCGSSFSVA